MFPIVSTSSGRAEDYQRIKWKTPRYALYAYTFVRTARIWVFNLCRFAHHWFAWKAFLLTTSYLSTSTSHPSQLLEFFERFGKTRNCFGKVKDRSTRWFWKIFHGFARGRNHNFSNFSHHSSMVGSRFQLLSAILILILLLITSLTLHVSASSPDVSPHMLP